MVCLGTQALGVLGAVAPELWCQGLRYVPDFFSLQLLLIALQVDLMLLAVLMRPLTGCWLQSVTQGEEVARDPRHEAVQVQDAGR